MFAIVLEAMLTKLACLTDNIRATQVEKPNADQTRPLVNIISPICLVFGVSMQV